MKGCICLDIDGTITSNPHEVPCAVVKFFHELHEKGWVFLFITGRLYSFAHAALRDMHFPYFFAVQNGADLLLMPEKKLLSREYLPFSCVPKLEELCMTMSEDFLLYSGWEKGDFCYYRPKKFSPSMLEYLEIVQSVSHKSWRALESFSFVAEETFPLIKLLGTKEEMFRMHNVLQQAEIGEVSCVKDPLSPNVGYLNLLTAKNVNKGKILEKMRSYFPKGTLFIAAGDDYNDLSMLQEADCAIAMANAPSTLLAQANIIANSAQENGIIQALQEATQEKISL